MDKEAQKKIIASVLLEETMRSEVAADMVALKIRRRLEAYGFGYRKPEGEPPLLNDEKLRRAEAEHAIGVPTFVENESRRALIAQAQRDSDIKWYGGE